MAANPQLTQFVHDALTEGRSRDEIRAAMTEAGWTPSEIADALATWADTPFRPPVPRPRPYVSAYEAFFYALMFVALGMTSWHLTDLGIKLVDLWMPRTVEAWRAQGIHYQLRWDISALIVFFPLFLLLQLREQKRMRSDPARSRSAVRKWFGYITLFLASMALLGDLLTAIYTFLRGQFTTAFALKVAIVALVAGVIFAWFRKAMNEAENAA